MGGGVGRARPDAGRDNARGRPGERGGGLPAGLPFPEKANPGDPSESSEKDFPQDFPENANAVMRKAIARFVAEHPDNATKLCQLPWGMCSIQPTGMNTKLGCELAYVNLKVFFEAQAATNEVGERAVRAVDACAGVGFSLSTHSNPVRLHRHRELREVGKNDFGQSKLC